MPTRYEREIQQILDESNHQENQTATNSSSNSEQSAQSARNSPYSSERRKSPNHGGFGITTYKIVCAGVFSMLLAGVLRWLFPPASGPLVWVGISLFIIAYLKYFIGPRRPIERRWRGQIIDLDPGRPPSLLVNAIKRFFKFTRF